MSASPEEKGDGVEAIKVTEAVFGRRQRLFNVVDRVGPLPARQEHGSKHAVLIPSSADARLDLLV